MRLFPPIKCISITKVCPHCPQTDMVEHSILLSITADDGAMMAALAYEDKPRLYLRTRAVRWEKDSDHSLYSDRSSI